MGLNIKSGAREPVGVYELGQFLVFTVADFADQLFSWQVCALGCLLAACM